MPDVVKEMSFKKEQKRSKKIMPPGKTQDVPCLFCCYTPPTRPLSDPLNGSKMIIFNFELGEKLDQYFDVKFDEESEFDSFEAEKLSRDP